MSHLRIHVGPRGRLPPNVVTFPGDKHRRVNWLVLLLWLGAITFWAVIFWRVLH